MNEKQKQKYEDFISQDNIELTRFDKLTLVLQLTLMGLIIVIMIITIFGKVFLGW